MFELKFQPSPEVVAGRELALAVVCFCPIGFEEEFFPLVGRLAAVRALGILAQAFVVWLIAPWPVVLVEVVVLHQFLEEAVPCPELEI